MSRSAAGRAIGSPKDPSETAIVAKYLAVIEALQAGKGVRAALAAREAEPCGDG
jgi:hypothetical protein